MFIFNISSFWNRNFSVTKIFLLSQPKNPSLHSIFPFSYNKWANRSRLVLSKGKDFVKLKKKSCSTPLFLQECKHMRTPVEAMTYISLRLLCTADVAACWKGFWVISLRSHGGIISCKPWGFLYKSWDWLADGALLLSRCFLWNPKVCSKDTISPKYALNYVCGPNNKREQKMESLLNDS